MVKEICAQATESPENTLWIIGLGGAEWACDFARTNVERDAMLRKSRLLKILARISRRHFSRDRSFCIDSPQTMAIYVMLLNLVIVL